MNIPGWVKRKKYDELYHRLLQKEQETEDLRELGRQQKMTINLLNRENKGLRQEIDTLNASLDATSDALEAARNTLRISEQERKRLLTEKKRRTGQHGH